MGHPMQELRLRQQMTLAPRLQQSVKLLQMSALEFTTAVQHALASNPFLEDPDDSEPESAAPAAPGIRGETADMEGQPTPEPVAASDSPDGDEPPPDAPAYSGD